MLALQNLLGHGKRLRYLCQDETRVGLKSETGKVITAKGVKPIATVQWQRDNFWIYGVVEPLSGWHFEQEYQHLNSEHFQSFLDALSLALKDDIALIQLDQAKAHQALALNWERIPDSRFSASSCSRTQSNRTVVAVSQSAIEGRKLCLSDSFEGSNSTIIRRVDA